MVKKKKKESISNEETTTTTTTTTNNAAPSPLLVPPAVVTSSSSSSTTTTTPVVVVGVVGNQNPTMNGEVVVGRQRTEEGGNNDSISNKKDDKLNVPIEELFDLTKPIPHVEVTITKKEYRNAINELNEEKNTIQEECQMIQKCIVEIMDPDNLETKIETLNMRKNAIHEEKQKLITRKNKLLANTVWVDNAMRFYQKKIDKEQKRISKNDNSNIHNVEQHPDMVRIQLRINEIDMEIDRVRNDVINLIQEREITDPNVLDTKMKTLNMRKNAIDKEKQKLITRKNKLLANTVWVDNAMRFYQKKIDKEQKRISKNDNSNIHNVLSKNPVKIEDVVEQHPDMVRIQLRINEIDMEIDRVDRVSNDVKNLNQEHTALQEAVESMYNELNTNKSKMIIIDAEIDQIGKTYQDQKNMNDLYLRAKEAQKLYNEEMKQRTATNKRKKEAANAAPKSKMVTNAAPTSKKVTNAAPKAKMVTNVAPQSKMVSNAAPQSKMATTIVLELFKTGNGKQRCKATKQDNNYNQYDEQIEDKFFEESCENKIEELFEGPIHLTMPTQHDIETNVRGKKCLRGRDQRVLLAQKRTQYNQAATRRKQV